MLRRTAAALAVAAWCAAAGAAFRSWFVLLADAQFERPTDDVQDCAALVRHAMPAPCGQATCCISTSPDSASPIT